MSRKFIFMNLILLSLSTSAFSRGRVLSLKATGGVIFSKADSQIQYTDNSYKYRREDFTLEGSITTALSLEFYLNRRIAMGFSHKKNTLSFRSHQTNYKNWGRTTHKTNDTSVYNNREIRQDYSFFLKAFLSRSFYLKMGLGYATLTSDYRSERTYSEPMTRTFNPKEGAITVPTSLGNEWHIGALDFAIDWISVNSILLSNSPELSKTPHEFSFCNLSLGFSI